MDEKYLIQYADQQAQENNEEMRGRARRENGPAPPVPTIDKVLVSTFIS